MITQLFAHCRFGSAIRTLTLALLLSGAVAPATLADHMGNHLRPPSDASSTDIAGSDTDECGQGGEYASTGAVGLGGQTAPGDPAPESTDEDGDLVAPPFRDGQPW